MHHPPSISASQLLPTFRIIFPFNKMTSPVISPNYAAEKFSLSLTDIQLIILVVGLFEFLLFHLLTDRKRIYAFLCGFQPSNQSHFANFDESKDRGNGREVVQEKRGEQSLSRADVDVVFRSLGIFSNGGEANRPLTFDNDDLSKLFEEENPCLEEVKDAFDVFDEDRDGFIYAEELQKVLCSLGFKEGLKLDNCRRMISEFDENGDARIDFEEFVRIMESSL